MMSVVAGTTIEVSGMASVTGVVSTGMRSVALAYISVVMRRPCSNKSETMSDVGLEDGALAAAAAVSRVESFMAT